MNSLFWACLVIFSSAYSYLNILSDNKIMCVIVIWTHSFGPVWLFFDLDSLLVQFVL